MCLSGAIALDRVRKEKDGEEETHHGPWALALHPRFSRVALAAQNFMPNTDEGPHMSVWEVFMASGFFILLK